MRALRLGMMSAIAGILGRPSPHVESAAAPADPRLQSPAQVAGRDTARGRRMRRMITKYLGVVSFVPSSRLKPSVRHCTDCHRRTRRLRVREFDPARGRKVGRKQLVCACV